MLFSLQPSHADTADWPSYNRTLTSERYASLNDISSQNVSRLQVLCTYDTGQMTSFQPGLIQVGDALYGATEMDTFAIDPNTCHEKWRVHETYTSANVLQVNRGVAFLDGRLFRGTNDGRVLAYDAKSGKRLWEVAIANPKLGESVPAAPIAWEGLVFVGNAGGDNKGVKGRMYAIEAATGKIVWEFFLVPKESTDLTRGPAAPGAPSGLQETWKTAQGFPITGGATWTSYTLDADTGLLYVPGGNPAPDFVKQTRDGDNLLTGSIVVLDARTGAYKRHIQLVPRDFHDWDVSTAPVLFTSRAKRRLMAVAPKDGHLYGYDLQSGDRLYRLPRTTIFNPEAPLTPEGTRFCPGSQGGAEWNGPAYDPQTNSIITGEVDWCATVKTAGSDALQSVALGQPWSGMATSDPAEGFGKMDPPSQWAGWLTATDADTGAAQWQVKTPYPLLGGVTPTAGGLVLFGDMGGTFYAVDARTGKELWSQKIGGAIGGGVITYDTGAGQKIAVAAGMTSPIWPTDKVTGTVVILGVR
ncbi:pyrroloquinoline quinone-dependent dehydrogenase [Microvirga sp. M2]|uniref:pyrroloquinoline quinone-dependent dehydrogenase n=1 Tax=Microvirga sp. M2 TaxID=3073270 RepID=UPI0039C16E37